MPLEPLVVQPVEGIGTYGGTLRRGSPARATTRTATATTRVTSSSSGITPAPSSDRRWPRAGSSATATESSRSSCVRATSGPTARPFTADDFVFWYEDIYLNEALVPVPQASFAINGKQGRIEKVDDLTVSFIFEDPYPLFLTILGGTTFMGSGHVTNRNFHSGSYAPAHYLKQFHPTTAQADIDRWPRTRTSRTGSPSSGSRTSGAQPGPAGARPLAYRLAGQHAELDHGAQPLLLRGRSRGISSPTSTASR